MLITNNNLISGWPNIVMAVIIVWLLIYFYTSYKKKKTFFLFSTNYLVCLLVFHFSHIGLHVFGLYEFEQFGGEEMGFWYQQAAWLVLLSLASFGIGNSLVTKREVEPSTDTLKNALNYHHKICWWYGLGLLCASLVFLMMLIYSVGNIFEFSRREIFGGVGDTRGFGVFQMTFPSALILIVIGAKSKIQKKLAFLIAIISGLIILLMGYRSVALFPLLVGITVWVKVGRRLNKAVAIFGMIFLLIAIPSVRYLRAMGSYESLSSSDLSASIEQAKINDVFLELGATSGVAAYVLKWMDEGESYRFGRTYLKAIGNSLPNIGFNIKGSDRENYSGLNVSEDDLLNMSASDWFIFRYDKWMFETGGGSGFSAIAEPYLNFGYIGVIIVFAFLGYALAKLDAINLKLQPKYVLVSSVIMWPLMKTVRNDFTAFLKPVIFMVIVLGIWRVATYWKNTKR